MKITYLYIEKKTSKRLYLVAKHLSGVLEEWRHLNLEAPDIT